MNVTINKFWTVFKAGEKSDAVAFCDASIGDFRIRGCSLRRRHDSGSYFAVTPGRGGGGYVIWLTEDSPIREELCTAMLELYGAPA